MSLQRFRLPILPVLLSLLLLLSNSQAHAHLHHRCLLLNLQGGDNSSPYELNPSYQPKLSKLIMNPPANQHHQQPFLPHQFHVETTAHPTYLPEPNSPVTQFSDFQSLRQSFQQYLRRLYQTNPDLFAIAATSVAIFLLWQIPNFHALLQNHFICQKRNLKALRYHVLLTSAASHFNFFHLLFNLITLLNLGPQVQTALNANSNASLWPLMVGAALTGSLFNIWLGHRDGCLGLSGVTLSLFALLARLYPQRIMSIRLMGIIPIRVASQMLLQLVVIYSVLGSLQTRSNIAHACHLGGIVYGLGFYEVWSRRRQWRGRRALLAGWKG